MKNFRSNIDQDNRPVLLFFHCVFYGEESIDHYMHEFDHELYRSLPNLYAVCIAETTKEHKKLTAGFFIKTDYTHHDSEFMGILCKAIDLIPRLKKRINENSSLIPIRLGIDQEEIPPTELEVLEVMVTQNLKISVGGIA